MAALFYAVNPARNIFRDGLVANLTIRIPFLDGLIGYEGFSIITDVSVQNSDTIQYFLTFDDFINYFYFGKGLGSLAINGIMFTNCLGDMPGVDMFYSRIAAYRGSTVDVSFGNTVFTGVISQFAINAESENMTAMFSIMLTIVDHSLPTAAFPANCTSLGIAGSNTNTTTNTTNNSSPPLRISQADLQDRFMGSNLAIA